MGNILLADKVAEALSLLREREHRKAPLDLILVDMHLPDGNGLDVLRHVKANPVWEKTPVIILSSETAPGIINEAYALGANCYLSKVSKPEGVFGSIQALYQCWIEGALLPQVSFEDKIEKILARGVHLRSRTAHFYLQLARSFSTDSEQEAFWLERAMTEGNMSNLLMFFQGQISDRDILSGLAKRTADMQVKVEKALNDVEASLKAQPCPAPKDICQWVVELLEAWDEEVFAEAFGNLFPRNPAVTTALKARAVGQLKELGGFLLKQSQEADSRRKADALLSFADRLETMLKPTDGTNPD
jgi:CheY-like chemotaxis protein